MEGENRRISENKNEKEFNIDSLDYKNFNCDILKNVPEEFHKEVASKLIEVGNGENLAENLEKFSGLDIEIVNKLIALNKGYYVADKLKHFIESEQQEIIENLIKTGNGSFLPNELKIKFKEDIEINKEGVKDVLNFIDKINKGEYYKLNNKVNLFVRENLEEWGRNERYEYPPIIAVRNLTFGTGNLGGKNVEKFLREQLKFSLELLAQSLISYEIINEKSRMSDSFAKENGFKDQWDEKFRESKKWEKEWKNDGWMTEENLEKLDNLYDKLKVDKLKEILEIVNSSKK